ncbi:MAG: hypothetical protein PHX21_01275 [bacterium]|nr:hypothetical protein [bacterium]
MGIIFLISALSLNFNPIENPLQLCPPQSDYTNLTQSPQLSSIPGAFLYTSTSKGFNPTPELGAKIYTLEGLGAVAGAVVIGGATLLAGGYMLLFMLFGGEHASIPPIIPISVMVAASSGIPLGAVYGIKKVGNHYQQEGSEKGALLGAITGGVLTCGLYGLGVIASPSPETKGVSPLSGALMCTSIFVFPVSTVIGYNYKHIFNK